MAFSLYGWKTDLGDVFETEWKAIQFFLDELKKTQTKTVKQFADLTNTKNDRNFVV